MANPSLLLATGIDELRLPLNEHHQHQLLNYLELLERWNQVYNLTAVREPDAMVTLHLLDSLSVLPYLHGNQVIDVGSGAGLPGIPLAITNPDRHFVVLDSIGKKTRFMAQAIQTLGLKNIDVVQARVEQYQPEQRFNTVISRAFAALDHFIKCTAHLCAPNGRFLAMKGAIADDERNTLPSGYRELEMIELTVPGLDAQRCLVCIETERNE